MKLYPLYSNQLLLISSSPTFTGLTVDGGELTLSGTATNHLVLPSNNDAATPTLAFGAGVGLYSTSVNNITMALGTANTWAFNAGYMGGSQTNMCKFRFLAATYTAPNILPRGDDDLDTGFGAGGADSLSIIAGGVEGIRVTESTTITTRLSDKTSISNTAEGNTGSLNIQTAREVHTLTIGPSSVTTGLNIPSTALVLGAAFCVNTAVTDSAGDDTWSAAFSGGDASGIVAVVAPAQNTKAHSAVVPALTNAETEITFTPQGGNFGAGVIEVVAWYIDLTDLANV